MKKWLTGGLAAAVLLGLMTVWVVKTPKPERMRVGNFFPRSFSVGWVTRHPTAGCLIAVARINNSKIVCVKDKKYTTHLAEFNSLEPKTHYRLIAVDGLRITWRNLPEVVTPAIVDMQPSLPRPAYGLVTDQVDNSLPHTLVYVYMISKIQRLPLIAMTNDSGNYSVDLSNFLPDTQSYLIEADSGPDRRQRLETDIRTSSPFPTIRLGEIKRR